MPGQWNPEGRSSLHCIHRSLCSTRVCEDHGPARLAETPLSDPFRGGAYPPVVTRDASGGRGASGFVETGEEGLGQDARWGADRRRVELDSLRLRCAARSVGGAAVEEADRTAVGVVVSGGSEAVSRARGFGIRADARRGPAGLGRRVLMEAGAEDAGQNQGCGNDNERLLRSGCLQCLTRAHVGRTLMRPV
jgi:hypothetical protein